MSDTNGNDSPIGDAPIYQQIAALLRQRINDEYWKPRDRLPTLEQLMSEFNVARATVRHALSLLHGEGLIERQRGRGTFVAESKRILRVVISAESDWNSFINELLNNTPYLIETKSADVLPLWVQKVPDLCQKYQYIARTHSIENLPFLANKIYVDEEIYQLSPFEIIHRHTIAIISKLPGITLTSCKQTFSFGLADVETAGLLNISVNSPIGVMHRVIRDDNGKAIFLAQNRYRANIVTIDIDVRF